MDEVLAATHANTANQVSMLVAKKAMDVDKAQAAALVEMIREAMAPQDVEPGRLDLYA
jgi:hypothetical protein